MTPVTCGHCGAVVTPPSQPPFQCSYCQAPMAAPELAAGRVWLTDEHVTALLRQRLMGTDSTFLHPSIPDKKLANARQIHLAHLPPGEVILGLYDGTAFGSAKDGFVVTKNRLAWKNTMEQAQFLEWAHIDPNDLWVDDNQIQIGRATLDTLFSEDDDGLYAWQEALQTIARSARPSAGQSAGPEAGWGGANVAVGGPAAAGAWGGLASAAPPSAQPMAWGASPQVERFAAPPYDNAADGVSIVDTHVSGEIVLAAGGGIVELRYAANGQRHLAFPAPGSVLCARFSPDGHHVLIGCTDNRASLYDVRTGQPRGATEEMEDYCDEVVWLGQSTLFAMASQRGELMIADAATMQITRRLLGPDPEHHQLGGLAATADGARLFVSVGERIGCFDTATGAVVWRSDKALINGSRLAVSPRGDVLVAAGYDGVALFDAASGMAGARYPFQCAKNVSWPEPREGGLMAKLRGDEDEDGLWSWSPRPRFSPAGDAVAVQDHVGNLCFIDIASGTLHPTPRDRGRAFIEDVAWFADSNHILLGMSDQSLAIWQARPLSGLMLCRAIDELPDEIYAHYPA